MAKRIKELQEAYARAFMDWKKSEMVANFYKQMLLEAMIEEGFDQADYQDASGTKVTAEFCKASYSRNFNQEKAKTSLKEFLGDAYVEDDFYNTNTKAPYVKITVDMSTENLAFDE